MLKPPLTDKEELLIIALRTEFPFSEVVIITRHGEPVRIKEAFRTKDLEFEAKNLTKKTK